MAVTGGTTSEAIRYLHTDHLNTPRLATNAEARAIWRWEGTAFGSTAPNEDPDGDGKLTTINLRFPGQYYDSETGLHYNWNRYYDPKIGRYVTSDPIGLAGGLNTYAYVENNPLTWVDPLGLCGEPPYPDYDQPLVPVYPECYVFSALSIPCGLANAGGKSSAQKGKTGKQKDGTPKNNQAQNKQARDAAKEAGGLTEKQQGQLHDAISGQNLSYQEILEIAKQIKNGTY